MGTLSKLRRLVLRDGMSVRQASRRLGISRNTATKWLSEPEMVEPQYPVRQAAASVLDAFKEQLVTWLKADSHRNKRERRGVKALFEALRAMGYGGSSSVVYRFAKRWKLEQSHAPKNVGFVRCTLSWERPSSLTGAANTLSLEGYAADWRWRTSSWRPAERSCWWPTSRNPMKCCLMPMPGALPCLVVCPSGDLRQYEDGCGQDW